MPLKGMWLKPMKSKNISIVVMYLHLKQCGASSSLICMSANSLIPTEEDANAATGVSMDSLYPVEFLNNLQFGDIANHKLELKVGVPILLLRNFNQSIGLCNGTRLIVKRLGQRVIETEIITGNNVDKRVFIPHIIMSPSRTDWPFVLRHR